VQQVGDVMSDATTAGTHRQGAAKRRTGRPRPPATEQSILRATVELLTEGGTRAATIDAIATRSGCAKTTIYRRWASRDALILQAFRVAVMATDEEIREAERFAATPGSTLRSSARNILRIVQKPLFQAAFPTIAQELLGGTSLGNRFRAEVFRPIRATLRAKLAESIQTGELRPGTNPDLVFDLVNGAILYRALVGEPIDEDVADGIADLITKGAGGETPA
jgi:AcrR family transcriptional regulator